MPLSRKEVGERVKQARQVYSSIIEEKYTQAMLAKDIGMSQSYIGDIESGRTALNFVMMKKIAKACHVEVSMFTDDGINGISSLERFAPFEESETDINGLPAVYLNIAKEARDKGIDPQDLHAMIMLWERARKRDEEFGNELV